MNKKFLLLYLLVFTSAEQNFFFAQSVNLSKSLDSLFADEFFTSTIAAVDIYDLTENKKLYSKNEKLLLRPASLQKILTTGTALLFLDDYKFKTKIYYDGEIEDSVCKGNLFVLGGCDPLFSLNDLDSLTKEIKKFGIKKISGNLYGDISMTDSLFWGDGWMWDDDPYPFAAFITPLSINRNSFKVVYKSLNVGEPVQIEIIPKTNYFEIVNTSSTTSFDTSDFIITRSRLNDNEKIIVTGNFSINSKQDTLSFSVANPSKFFLKLFAEKLNENGISFSGNVEFKITPDDAKEIFSFERDIDTVLIYTNKTSYNLGAELILRALAHKYFGKPATTKNGILLIDSLITLSGFNSQKFKIVDGSGLSFYNLVSAELITSILKYFYYEKENLFVKLYNTFPISGYDGTLKNRMHNSVVYRKVRAKTGTLSGISNLAGYMFNHKNHLIAFSILMQNFVTAPNKARDFQDKICEIIYNN